ncbi:hypothetical protein [uncultured Pelagimonas sp.]|uniref:hypothetical protein n=1 Tax=uncultured Pelagimonas sp. TaxID=1618102 RepID=UPI0026168221|nr:hypothetical protein [uncultured Pelagimonas sp.]
MTNPILQLMPTPYRLRRATYENAYSPTNSNGNFASAYALRSLVDPIPLLTQEYEAGASCEQTYGDVLKGADGGGDHSFANLLINDARQVFQEAALSTLSVAPSQWRAVSALPQDWMKPNVEGFEEAVFHPKRHKLTGLGHQFQTLDPGKPLALQLFNETGARPARPETEVEKVTISVLQVNISRPWLDMALFKTRGWSLPGQPAGFVSNGKINASNTGLFPLVVTGFLIGQTLSVSAKFATEDEMLLKSGAASDAAIGPFCFPADEKLRQHPKKKPPELYLFGMVSQALPFSPNPD